MAAQLAFFEMPATRRKPKKAAPIDPETKAMWRDWYAGYPRHVAPDAGLRAFWSVIRNGRATLAELIAGRDRYAEQCRHKGTEEQYICHPATWLNAGRWADEYRETVAPDTAAFARVGARYRAAGDHRR